MDRIEITRIDLLKHRGPDRLLLHTRLPEGCYPFVGEATLSLEVAAGTGEEYAARNFPNTPLVLLNP